MSSYCKVRLLNDEETYPKTEVADGVSVDQLAYKMPNDCSQNPLQLLGFSDFIAFINTYNPELLRILNCLLESPSMAEAEKRSGLNYRLFNRARVRLSVLYRCYEAGLPPPRQRCVYRDRERR